MEVAVAERTEMGSEAAVIRLVRDDITMLDVDAFVFHAQHDLALGSGFGGAISVRGGPSVQKELDELGPVETGAAVITGAGRLKAEYIIHAVGPRFREPDIEAKLRKTVLSALACAEEKELKRIAFPALGAGYYGIPPVVTARVTVDTIREYLAKDTGIEEIVICVFDTPQFDAFQAVLAAQS
jgi:O-acetyl-ADP-ribose deacetylase (regulator of RNase III)